ncbi:MAG: DNA polymerase III subunit delta [Proteobacteria bacterium]|nr:DNA polymerase III subunit delta [Pseudomonadota bacterium]
MALIYGPNQGLVRERARIIAQSIVEDLSDPFRVSSFSSSELKAEPTQLVDTATAYAMTGGRRLIRVESGTDDITASLRLAIDTRDVEGFVVIEGGDLNPRSPVRKLCEGEDCIGVIACYADDEAALSEVINQVAAEHKLRIGRDARAFLLQQLGADRGSTRGEMEKLALMVGDNTEVSLQDAIASVGDNAALSIDEIVFSVADGDLASLDRQLTRALNEGTAPVTLIRAAMRHFQRLHQAAAKMAQGQSSDQAVKSLRPPILFLHVNRVKRQLDRWAPERLADALVALTDTELACKTTGLPAEAVCGRALISLARAAGRGSRRAASR